MSLIMQSIQVFHNVMLLALGVAFS
jgi:hypothetical protein